MAKDQGSHGNIVWLASSYLMFPWVIGAVAKNGVYANYVVQKSHRSSVIGPIIPCCAAHTALKRANKKVPIIACWIEQSATGICLSNDIKPILIHTPERVIRGAKPSPFFFGDRVAIADKIAPMRGPTAFISI